MSQLDKVGSMLGRNEQEDTVLQKIQSKVWNIFELIYRLLFHEMREACYIGVLVVWALVVTYITSQSKHSGLFISVSYYYPLCKWGLSFALLVVNSKVWDFFSKNRKCLVGLILVSISFAFWLAQDIIAYQFATWYIIRTAIVYIIIHIFIFYIIGLIPQKVEVYLEKKEFNADAEKMKSYYYCIAREYPLSFKMNEYLDASSYYHFQLTNNLLDRVQQLQEQNVQQEYALAKETQYVAGLYHRAKNDTKAGELDVIEWNARFKLLKEQMTERLKEGKSEALVLTYVYMAYFSGIPVKIHSFSKEEADDILLDKVKNGSIMVKPVMDFIISELEKSELPILEQMELLSKFNKLVVTQMTNEGFIKN